MKLTEFTNPMNGAKGNIFSLGDIWSNILGVFFLFLVFAMGQRFASFVGNKVPAIDTQVERPWADRPAPIQGNTKIVV